MPKTKAWQKPILEDVSKELDISLEQAETLPSVSEVVDAYRACAEELGPQLRTFTLETVNCLSAGIKAETDDKETKFSAAKDLAQRSAKQLARISEYLEMADGIRQGTEKGRGQYRKVILAVGNMRKGEPAVPEYEPLISHFKRLDLFV